MLMLTPSSLSSASWSSATLSSTSIFQGNQRGPLISAATAAIGTVLRPSRSHASPQRRLRRGSSGWPFGPTSCHAPDPAWEWGTLLGHLLALSAMPLAIFPWMTAFTSAEMCGRGQSASECLHFPFRNAGHHIDFRPPYFGWVRGRATSCASGGGGAPDAGAAFAFPLALALGRGPGGGLALLASGRVRPALTALGRVSWENVQFGLLQPPLLWK